MCAALYFGINWVADNPKKFNQIREQMNDLVATGFEKATDLWDNSSIGRASGF